jgi:hypothetical protein
MKNLLDPPLIPGVLHGFAHGFEVLADTFDGIATAGGKKRESDQGKESESGRFFHKNRRLR